MIDKNVCDQISPPHSSSTPVPIKEMLHVKPSPTSSPPPTLHEGPCAGFSTVSFKMEEEREEEGEEASDIPGVGGLEQSSEPETSDSVRKSPGCEHSHLRSRSWRGSLERLAIRTAEDEEGNEEERSSVFVLSEGTGRSNILADLSGTSLTSREKEWTPESCSITDSVLIPEDECDLGDCVSLAVEVSSSSDAPRHSDSHSKPPLSTPCASQRIVSPETDSGFGSSYLNQSTSGPFQSNLLPGSVQSLNGALSSSDSEGSCSNLQTAIHSASLNSQRWASSYPSVQTQSCGAAAAVELWVESTTKEPSVRLQARIEDWISSDMDPSKSKGTDSGDTEGSEIMSQFHSSPVGSRRGSSTHSGLEFQFKHQGILQSNRGTDCSVKTAGSTSSVLKGGGAPDSHAKQTPQTFMESFYSKERWSRLASSSLQKPLLQVGYGSSSSLPASYKVRESPLHSTSHPRKQSTQSDTALLPSNVYFQQTLSPVSVPLKTVNRTGRRRGSKEEEMDRTLDQAIEVARNMKRTTERMAKRLSADLAKAQLCRKLHNMQPLGGRKHHAL
ncbi:hypothetical protein INR49_010589 [Caranx melampygus]|nr:hypothetical protein INR49_010589 [Caranx melampygus]